MQCRKSEIAIAFLILLIVIWGMLTANIHGTNWNLLAFWLMLPGGWLVTGVYKSVHPEWIVILLAGFANWLLGTAVVISVLRAIRILRRDA